MQNLQHAAVFHLAVAKHLLHIVDRRAWDFDRFKFGGELALQYYTGYVIEKALSVDNIFVFVVLFAAFAVPKIYEHRVLFWGVIGAILMRAVFIGLGAALIVRFHWVMYVFGAILIITGIKLPVMENCLVLVFNCQAIECITNPY